MPITEIQNDLCSGGSRISRKGEWASKGVWTPGVLTFRKFYMSKRKNLDPWGSMCRARPPSLDPPMLCKNTINYATNCGKILKTFLNGYSVADPGGPRGPGPPSPHFWGPRLYSEAQIAPFYTQITEKFSKKFCLASLAILFQFSIDIFWSKTLTNYSFLRSQIIFWGPNCTFLHSNNRKNFKTFLPCFSQHTISILKWHILIKNIKKLFILRP